MKTGIERHPGTPSPDTPAAPDHGIVHFIRRHAVTTYYVLAFAISWGGIVLVVGPAGMFSTGTTLPMAGGVALTAGPAVAGLVLTGLADGRTGLRRLGSRLRRWRVGGRWYAMALLTGPLVMGATALGISLVSPGFYHGFDSAGGLWGTVLGGIALGLAVGCLEELGWTGFALPRLRWRYGVFSTGLIMGLLWGAWHFPMFAGNADPTGTLPDALVVAVFLFAWLPPYRVLMVWVYDRTESLPIAMLMHVPITATAFILGSMTSEATSGIALLAPPLVSGVTFWLIIAGVAWANGGHLTGRWRRP